MLAKICLDIKSHLKSLSFFPLYMFDIPNFLSFLSWYPSWLLREKHPDFPHSQGNSHLKLLSLDLRAGAGAADVNLLVPWSGRLGGSLGQFWDVFIFVGGGLGFNLSGSSCMLIFYMYVYIYII